MIAAAIWLICACGSANNEPVVFAVGGAPSEVAFWEELLRDFQQQSGIRVELLRQPSDTDQRRQGLVIALNARMPDPDVFLMDVAWMGLFVASGWLEPLEDEVDAAPFFQRVIRLVDRHQGQLMALPVYLDGGILYYRRDLLERFQLPGPPGTWNELLSQALTVQNVRCAKPIRAFTALSGRAPSTRDLSAILWNSADPGADLSGRRTGLQLDVVANRTALDLYAGSDLAASDLAAEHVYRDERGSKCVFIFRPAMPCLSATGRMPGRCTRDRTRRSKIKSAWRPFRLRPAVSVFPPWGAGTLVFPGFRITSNRR